MQDFMELYRKRVDEALQPHRELYGDDSPVVKMGLRLLQEAEAVQQKLDEARVGTYEAAERTGWSVDTLQKYAKLKLEGEPVPDRWADLVVELDGAGAYAFVVGSIPTKRGQAA